MTSGELGKHAEAADSGEETVLLDLLLSRLFSAGGGGDLPSGELQTSLGSSFAFVEEDTKRDERDRAVPTCPDKLKDWTQFPECIKSRQTMHRAVMKNLNPSHRYFYRVGFVKTSFLKGLREVFCAGSAEDPEQDSETSTVVAVSQTFSVRTPPIRDDAHAGGAKPLAYAVFGDVGMASVQWRGLEDSLVNSTVTKARSHSRFERILPTEWYQSALSFLGLKGNAPKKSTIFLDLMADNGLDVMAHLGDIAYWLNDVGDEYMRKLEPLAAQKPYLVSPGNHEAPLHLNSYTARFQNMPNRMISSEARGNLEDGNLRLEGLSPVQLGAQNVRNNHWYSVEHPGFAKWIFLSEGMFVAYTDKADAARDLFVGEVYKGHTTEAIEAEMHWVEQELKNVDRKAFPWVFVGGHRPAYCTNLSVHCTTVAAMVRDGGKKILEESAEQGLSCRGSIGRN